MAMMVQMVILVAAFLLSTVCSETPYTQICEKERPKGNLPNICVEYCKIADQGCLPGIWEWKNQNGCTQEQEDQYIEMRKYTLQVCQDYLENCYDEEGETVQEESCVTFCQMVETEGLTTTLQITQHGWTGDKEKYDFNLQKCRETRNSFEEIETDPNGETTEKQTINCLEEEETLLTPTTNPSQSNPPNPITHPPKTPNPTPTSNPKPNPIPNSPKIPNPTPNSNSNPIPNYPKTPNPTPNSNSNPKELEKREYTLTDLFSFCNSLLVVVLCAIVLIVLVDNRRAYSQLHAKIDQQNVLLNELRNLKRKNCS